MAAERMEFKITLACSDRDLMLTQPLVLSRHASETNEHVVLRVLSWCLLYDEALTFGPGLAEGDAPDLEARDLTGGLRSWIACGDADVDLLRKVLQHHRDTKVHLVWGDDHRRTEFLAAVARMPRLPRGWERLSLWQFDTPLVHGLADLEGRRHRWNVTMSGDVFYVEAEGKMFEGQVHFVALPGLQG